MVESAADPPPPPSGGVARRDFVAGCAAGASSVAVGQPFDTVKVRVQTLGQDGSSSAWRVAVTTVREEGVRALFKGMSAPLVMTGASNAIVFSAKGAALRVVCPGSEPTPADATGVPPPPLWAVVLSGNVAGLASTVVGTPMELVKCRLQVQGSSGSAMQYTGAIDCVQQTLTQRGIAGLYCGQAIMCVREPAAFGVYFGCYDAVKRGLCSATGLGDNSALVQCTAGAATGMATWLTVCPVDVVKSRIQCRPVEIRTGTLATVREMLAEVLSSG